MYNLIKLIKKGPKNSNLSLQSLWIEAVFLQCRNQLRLSHPSRCRCCGHPGNSHGGYQCFDQLPSAKPVELQQNALDLSSVVTETLRQGFVSVSAERADGAGRWLVCLWTTVLVLSLRTAAAESSSCTHPLLLTPASPPPPPHSPASPGSLPTLSHWAIPHIFHSVTHSGPHPALTHAALDSWTEIRGLCRWTPSPCSSSAAQPGWSALSYIFIIDEPLRCPWGTVEPIKTYCCIFHLPTEERRPVTGPASCAAWLPLMSYSRNSYRAEKIMEKNPIIEIWLCCTECRKLVHLADELFNLQSVQN